MLTFTFTLTQFTTYESNFDKKRNDQGEQTKEEIKDRGINLLELQESEMWDDRDRWRLLSKTQGES